MTIRSMTAKAVLMGTTSLLLCGASAHAQTADGEDYIDEVIAVGIRASLNRGASIKKNADGVVDAITAEEFGKFPDANVAESLQRVTGVAITRSRGGEGRFVTVRGLGEEFNNVTYNGRTLATENLGREFSFDVVASELISRAAIYKTSQAKLGDGSIGGLVNIESAKPLSSTGFHAAGSIAGEHDNLTDEIGLRASGVVSNTFADDTIGVLASFSVHKRDVRSDTYESIDYTDLDFVSKDLDGTTGVQGLSVFDPGRDTASDIVGRARHSTYSAGTNFEERERIGGTLAVQFQPTDDLDVTADLLYTKYSSPGESNYTTIYFGSLRDESVTLSADGNTLDAYTADFTSDLVARSFDSDTDTIQMGLNGSYRVNDRLELNGDVAFSKAEGVRDNNGSAAGGGNFLVLGIPGSVATYQERGEVDSLSVQVPNYDSTLAPAFLPPTEPGGDPIPVNALGADGNQITGGAGTGFVDISQADPRLLRAHFNRISSFEVEDEVFSFKGGGDFDVNDNAVLSFGVDYTDRTKGNKLFANSDATTNGQCEFCGYAYDFTALNPTAAAGFANPLAFNYLSGGVPQGFLAFSAADFRQFFSGINVGDFNTGNAGLPSAGTPILQPALDGATSNKVEEQILGAFLQMNLLGELADIPYDANFGVRIVKTDVTSIGNQARPVSVIIASDGLNQSFPLSPLTPTSISGDYTNFLPSANVKFDLTDNIFLRLAASKTISRPTLTDLSTRFSVPSTNLGVEQIDTGNPGLEAPEATNLDVSVEWYADNGFTSSVAVFHKDIEGFVANRNTMQTLLLTEVNPGNVPAGTTAGQRDFLVSQPTNAEEASVTGIELAAQYIHETGFGGQVNATFVDSSAKFAGQSSDLGLENVSPLSYNVSGFYENDRISARLSYNFREQYLQTTSGLQNHAEYVDDYGQIDFTSSYNINDNFSVFLDAINLNEESSYAFSEYQNLIRNYEENGRRVLFGVRGNF